MRLYLPGKQKVFGWLGIKKVPKTARCKHYPCAQCWALCTAKVQGCCHLLGGGWGLVEEGCQRKAWEGCWDTGGLICILTTKGCTGGKGALHGVAHLLTTSSMLQCCLQARIWYTLCQQEGVEYSSGRKTFLIARVPVKHLLENEHRSNTKTCRQISGLQDPTVANGPVGTAFVSRSFPAQACASAVWHVVLLLDYFDLWTFAAVNQMMCLLVLAWCFVASKHGMVGGCKTSLHFYTGFTPL